MGLLMASIFIIWKRRHEAMRTGQRQEGRRGEQEEMRDEGTEQLLQISKLMFCNNQDEVKEARSIRCRSRNTLQHHHLHKCRLFFIHSKVLVKENDITNAPHQSVKRRPFRMLTVIMHDVSMTGLIF